MKIQQHVIDAVTVLEVRGRVVLPEEVRLREALRAAVDQGARDILIDLGKVRVMDSSGVGMLAAAHTSAGKAGAELKLCSLSDRLLDILHTVRLHMVFEILPTRDAGIEAFREQRRLSA